MKIIFLLAETDGMIQLVKQDPYFVLFRSSQLYRIICRRSSFMLVPQTRVDRLYASSSVYWTSCINGGGVWT